MTLLGPPGGASWSLLKGYWGPLGGLPGTLKGPPERLLGALGASLGRPSALLERFTAVLGPSWRTRSLSTPPPFLPWREDNRASRIAGRDSRSQAARSVANCSKQFRPGQARGIR